MLSCLGETRVSLGACCVPSSARLGWEGASEWLGGRGLMLVGAGCSAAREVWGWLGGCTHGRWEGAREGWPVRLTVLPARPRNQTVHYNQ